MRLVPACLLAALALSASAPAASAPALVGKVTVSAGELQCETACGVPAQPVVLQFRSASGVLRVVTTNAKGGYRAFLPPGAYSVAAPQYRNAGLTPTRVVVRPSVTRTVAFIIRIARA